MATVLGNSLPIDPMKTAKYPITIHKDLLAGVDASSDQYVSVQYNHKPPLPNNSKTIISSSSTDPNTYKLSLASPSSTLTYTGTQHPTSTHALFYVPSTQSFTLAPISTSFAFNSDSKTHHPSLPTTTSQNLEDPADLLLSPSPSPSSTGDPSNPYDYRHFLKPQFSPSPSPGPQQSIEVSPQPNCQRKRRRSPSPVSDQNNDEDDDILTIEIDPSTQRRKNRFQGAFAGLANGGPISLRSAASSLSPAAREEVGEEIEELILDDAPHVSRGEESEDDEEEEEADGSDAAEEDGDDDDALAEELEQALESQAGEAGLRGGRPVAASIVGNGRLEESSSESEEE